MEASEVPGLLHGPPGAPKEHGSREEGPEESVSPFITSLRSHIESLVPGHRPAQIQVEGTWSLLLSGSGIKKSTAMFPNCHTHFTDR